MKHGFHLRPAFCSSKFATVLLTLACISAGPNVALSADSGRIEALDADENGHLSMWVMENKAAFLYESVPALEKVILKDGMKMETRIGKGYSLPPAGEGVHGNLYRNPWRKGNSPRKSFKGIKIGYQSFTGSQMEECYENAMIVVSEVGVLEGHYGGLLEMGYISKEGEPIRLMSGWNISSAKLSMWAIPITATFLYQVREYNPGHLFHPYIGYGLGFVFGGEKIEVRANDLLEEWGGWLWSVRGSVFGSAVLGLQMDLGRELSGVIEARWTNGSRGGTADLVDEENQEEFDSYLYRFVNRSSYDFTGWSIEVGLRW